MPTWSRAPAFAREAPARSRRSRSGIAFAILLAAVSSLAASSGAPPAQGDWKRITPVRKGPAMPMPENAQQTPPARSVRLIFEYEGDRVRLVSQQPVDTALVSPAPAGEQPGYFVDTRDASDATLARVAAPNAFAGSAEVFPENPADPITRIDVPTPKGAFTVVVPAPEATHHLTVLRITPPRPPEPGRERLERGVPEVIDLVSFPFDLRQ